MNPLLKELWHQWKILWPQLQPTLQPLLDQAHGTRVAVVGGAVRDLCLGRIPKDLDLVAESNYLEYWAVQTNLTYTAFSGFGNVTLKITDPHWPLENRKLDLIRARTETYPIPGAPPVVKAGTLEEDLCRRDFTVNALALELTHDPYLPLFLDVAGGLNDLRTRQLRPLHSNSLYEDASRLVRAARLKARLNLEASPELLEQIPQALMMAEQTPRFWRELALVIDEPQIAEVVDCLGQWGLALPSAQGINLGSPRKEKAIAWLAREKNPEQRRQWAERMGWHWALILLNSTNAKWK